MFKKLLQMIKYFIVLQVVFLLVLIYNLFWHKNWFIPIILFFKNPLVWVVIIYSAIFVIGWCFSKKRYDLVYVLLYVGIVKIFMFYCPCIILFYCLDCYNYFELYNATAVSSSAFVPFYELDYRLLLDVFK